MVTKPWFPLFVFWKLEEGGPVIAVQVENEYGSYAKDDEYMPFIKNVSFLLTLNVYIDVNLASM